MGSIKRLIAFANNYISVASPEIRNSHRDKRNTKLIYILSNKLRKYSTTFGYFSFSASVKAVPPY